MKKDRNTFFSGYGYNSMNPGMGQMGPSLIPNQVAANTNFYAGPAVGGNVMPGSMVPQTSIMPSDIDSRLSKLERHVNRLEMRINKIEGDTGQTPGNYPESDYNYANSMYMV
ncbi:MAG: hypothetical protein PHH51_02125 [Bacilli bacterium]|nr:hypothetical protein [Bacilli bacterium]MDD3895878.1 hypothetical protein [Bacilli bacterium]MDD4407760.1 hypothetical protein [Bacilli bacterium]